MAEAVYLLGTITSLVCAGLLLRSYYASRTNLLLWSSLCFVGLAANNVLLLIDLYAIPDINLARARTALVLASLLLLKFGLFWDVR